MNVLQELLNFNHSHGNLWEIPFVIFLTLPPSPPHKHKGRSDNTSLNYNLPLKFKGKGWGYFKQGK